MLQVEKHGLQLGAETGRRTIQLGTFLSGGPCRFPEDPRRLRGDPRAARALRIGRQREKRRRRVPCRGSLSLAAGLAFG